MKEFIEFIAKHLVDKPEAVRVEETEENNKINFKLFVDDPETGKVIGKSGKTAKALRTLLTAIAAKEGKRAFLEIPDKINKQGDGGQSNDEAGE
ncbi:MAG: KH domain-containing protein [Ignavibacteriae bacterium]|nr:KH domain-containing protein [Ignavibacteriota bacterium]MCB0725441.1 KH domain-containing protein [Ignavibacteriota bacterium]MCB9243407.1 KH domain-containing protein [Ignavibacteriales bacterium]